MSTEQLVMVECLLIEDFLIYNANSPLKALSIYRNPIPWFEIKYILCGLQIFHRQNDFGMYYNKKMIKSNYKMIGVNKF